MQYKMTDASTMTAANCEAVAGLGKYQYIVYAVLGTGVFASEVLGLTKYVKPNTIIEVVIWFSKNCFVPFMKKREDKAKTADPPPPPGAVAESKTTEAVAAVSNV